MSRLVVVGDALLDRDVDGSSSRRSPDSGAPVLERAAIRSRPGGAGLAALLAAADGRPVTLVAAFAADRASEELSRALLAAGVDLVQLRLQGTTPEKIRFRDRERALMRLDCGGDESRVEAAGAVPTLRAALAEAAAVLVSDYGRGVAAAAEVRTALRAAIGAGTPLVWDPHPHGARPLAGASLVTPNLVEARAAGGSERDAEELAGRLVGLWEAKAVAVTLGQHGAVVAGAAGRSASPAPRESSGAPESAECPVDAARGDPCGAGDGFAAAAAWALADGAAATEASGTAARLAARFVAAGGVGALASPPRRRWPWNGADPDPRLAPALALAERTRAAGGTVVATGGCFDLLHVGHVRCLQAARQLGDRLVVLLNSDSSVRALKGADRPLVAEGERAETLRALECVDEVAIFEQREPTTALRHLRPDVWAKGGDYAVDELPEAEAVATWGGRVAILPYLEGRSTTRLIEEVESV